MAIIRDLENMNVQIDSLSHNNHTKVQENSSISILDAFYRSLDHRMLAKATIETNTRDIKHLVRFLKEKGVEPDLMSVTQRLVHDWVITQIGEGYSSNTIRKRLATASSIYKYLIDVDVVQSNPFKRVRVPNVRPQTRPKYLELEEIADILKATKRLKEEGTDIELIVRMMLFSGLRTHQLVALKVKDVTFEEGKFQNSSGYKHQVNPLPPLLTQLIKHKIQQKGLKPEDSLIYGLAGLPIQDHQLQRITLKLKKQLGWTDPKRVTVNQFRWSMARLLCVRGLNPDVVSQFLGISPTRYSLPFYPELFGFRQERLEQALTQLESDLEEGGD
jgi:site-specific recombinase XerD